MNNDRPVVLIVDDEPLSRQHLAEVLAVDHRVKAAASGPQALDLARRAPYPELILLDVMMPEMDGYAVCAALKADPLTATTPVLFITAKTDTASETAALAAGAVDFIHKPINPEVVRARVRLQRELTQHRQCLEELVHARTRELAQARDAAESANRAKSAFLRMVSHEMNTPLHQISALSILLGYMVSDAFAKQHLMDLDQATQRLLELVRNLLDLTQLEAGEIRLAAQPFDPRAWLTQGIAARTPAAKAKGLHLLTEVVPEMPGVLIGDPQRLDQILTQLLDNAIKFTDQGNIQVRLRVGERQGQRLPLELEVEDEGCGLDTSQADRLFERFAVGDDSRTRQHGGMGLGLALCQRLVKLMSGEIRLVSALGQGATVTCSIPLEIAPPASGPE